MLNRLGHQTRRSIGKILWSTGLVSFCLFFVAHDPHLWLRQSEGALLLACGVLALLVTLGYELFRQLDAVTSGSTESRPVFTATTRDLLAGGLLISAIYLCLSFFGGGSSRLYPLLYLFVAFLFSFHRRTVAWWLIGFVVGVETLVFLTRHSSRFLFASHLLFILLFALAYELLLRADHARHRYQQNKLLRSLREKAAQDAREFRLISTPLSAQNLSHSRAEAEARLLMGSVESIRTSLYRTLALLKKSLRLNTCMLLWVDETGEQLRIKECVTDYDGRLPAEFSTDAGALGTAIKNRTLVNLKQPKAGHIPYYNASDTESFPQAFLCTPAIEGGHLRGLLCFDRIDNVPFIKKDEDIAQIAVEQILQLVESERTFTAVERAKYEYERFFAALAQLNRARQMDQVCQTMFDACREICQFDLAAVTLFDRETNRHTVISAAGKVPSGLEGLSFADNAGIASMVVKNKHFLPAAGEIREKDVMVYTKRVRLEGMESLLVIPLLWNEQAIGSFAVAAQRPRAFGPDKREMLSVIANHAAVSIANAQMYGQMEKLATTDGLTGLTNHRTFQERFAEMLARAERTGVPITLLLTDVDHFKKVNDTYGHPVGDQVLIGVARVARECVRKIDLAARYGGEEFAIVLEGTSLEGGIQLADRIRKEVQEQSFASDKGPFSVTLSLGIATYPTDGADTASLIARADQALYEAKRSGRNRAIPYRNLAPPRLQAL